MNRYHACLHGSIRNDAPLVVRPGILVVEVHQVASRSAILKQPAEKICADCNLSVRTYERFLGCPVHPTDRVPVVAQYALRVIRRTRGDRNVMAIPQRFGCGTILPPARYRTINTQPAR